MVGPEHDSPFVYPLGLTLNVRPEAKNIFQLGGTGKIRCGDVLGKNDLNDRFAGDGPGGKSSDCFGKCRVNRFQGRFWLYTLPEKQNAYSRQQNSRKRKRISGFHVSWY
jgi:hypothetical protein